MKPTHPMTNTRPLLGRLARVAALALLLAPGFALTPGARAGSQPDAGASETPAAPAAHQGVTYTLAPGHETWPEAARAAITAAMDEAVALYNAHSTLSHALTANYNPAVPTAQASASGWIDFGGSINARVAIHEIAHTFGVGTTPQWAERARDGRWTGPAANLLLARLESNPDAQLNTDARHFWPYGLNYDREDGPEQRVRHVQLVAAFHADMGLAGVPAAQPANPPADPQTAGQPETQPEIQPDAQPEPPQETQPQAQPEVPTQPATQTPPAEVRPLPAPRPAEFTDPIPLGSEDGDDKAHIRFTPYSAGIASLSLPDAYNAVGDTAHIELQAMATDPATGFVAVPFAVLGVEIEGDFISLSGAQGAPIWSQAAPGVFVAHVDTPDGSPLLRITRTYALKGADRYGFTITTAIDNLSPSPVNARLVQTGPIDLPEAENNYAGDKRRFRFGYLNPPERQADLAVHVDERLDPRTELLGKRVANASGFKTYPATHPVWPNERTVARGQRLAWLAFSDRYFAVVVHPLFDPAAVAKPEDKLLTGLGPVDRLVLNPAAPAPQTVMVLRFNGDTTPIAAGASHTTRFGVYAGPMSRPTIREDLLLASLRVPELVVYNLGGMCAPCTFHWLTDALMSVLRLFHAVTGDWAVAIMLLVVLVRGVLHPVTRWSQIRMQKFGVQMQAMAPKQAKLKEKYKDDPKKLQQEMGKLWKEEGINPAGMLGCLPMFLQSPVWIALYATLFFAIELRQSAAFYGAFQSISGGRWEFLADLSVPDHAIPLPEFMHFSFPLWGAVQAINILPILMGVLMWAHQKFLTPPTTATMTPEQEQQQKIIKVMMVVMFPLMMYAAPAGLTIYFITNSALGIGEHKWIRAHMNKHGLLDPEKIKAERQSKGPGFMSRLSEAAEAQKRLQAQAHGGRPPIIPDKKRKKK